MKKIFLLILLAAGPFVTSAQLKINQSAQQQPASFPNKKYLLQTAWDQFGLYARYSPDKNVLGCWSAALAQVLYYHRLTPSGIVSYTCSKGYVIQDTLSNYKLQWKNFTAKLDSASTASQTETVARYSYLTAAAIQKDFGTGRYLEAVNPVSQIEKHYKCTAEFYGCFTGDIPLPAEQMNAIAKKENIRHIIKEDSVMLVIQKEIDAKRPVYFHYGNFTTYGHSTVIDGYTRQNGIFWVHINYGASGFRSGWYNLFRPIDVADDIKLRAFVTINPL
jgi:hypothetical protein